MNCEPISSFEFSLCTRLVLGRGVWTQAFAEARAVGQNVLSVTGATSLSRLGLERALAEEIERCGLRSARFSVPREPDIELADSAGALARAARADVVLAIGGGSALDVGKAAALLATNPGSARDYLEGIPGAPPRAIAVPPLPVICVPTTSGTGSELTKNAVFQVPDLSVKRSMRSPQLFPRAAFVDPSLSGRAPRQVRGGSGFDALTHLVEAFCSRNASPVSDALARDGIPRAAAALRGLALDESNEADALDLALAAALGGMCLANAGLGAAHGLIAPLGGLYPNVPHGAGLACLLPATLRVNEEAARGLPAVEERLAELARLLAGPSASLRRAADELSDLRRALQLPALASYGSVDVDRVIENPSGSLKTNPVSLDNGALRKILELALDD